MKDIFIIILIFCSFPIVACQQKGKHEKLSDSPLGSQEVGRIKTAKPGASVSLASANKVTISENKESIVIILLKAQSASEIIHIKLNASEGLQVLSNTEAQDVPINADGYYHLPISVLVSGNGRYYLNLQVNIGNAEDFISRTLAVIIQAGEDADADKLPLQMMKSSAEENVISLPANETIQFN